MKCVIENTFLVSLQTMPPKRIILDEKLYVQRSTIPNAGMGLFALKRIPSGARIGKYLGDVVTDLTSYDEDYIIETMPYVDIYGKYIEPVKLCGKRMDNKMRWINDPRYDKRRINAQTVQTYLGEIEVRATREIQPAEEILMTYGPFYWKKQEEEQLRMWTNYQRLYECECKEINKTRRGDTHELRR